MLPTVEEAGGYDFLDTENADKWRGLLVNALRKVLEQVHPTLIAEDNALEYVESLCLRLLAMLCGVPSPLTVQDVEERVARTFPTPLDKWALLDAREYTTKKGRKALFPTDKIHQLLTKEVLLYKITPSVSTFMTAIIEYVAADIFKLAGNFVKKISQKSGFNSISSRDIKTAMCADKVLMDMFQQDSELAEAEAAAAERRCRRGSISYAELVRDLLTDEKHFLRDLNLIIRVFKDEMEKILDHDSHTISLIFGNIVDIYELTVTLLGNLEDAMEMSQDTLTPYIGSCFEELAEVEEFRAYVRYANIVTRKESRDKLQSIVDDPKYSERLDTAGHGFRLAVKYYLPKLLMAPVAHVFLYHNYVLALLQLAPATEDRESFKQVECNLHPIKKLLVKALGNGPKTDATLRMAARARRQVASEKCGELARVVDNWDSKDIVQYCNEFMREDTLSKMGPGKRIAERRAYLFDGLLLLCKPITSLVASMPTSLQVGVGASSNNSSAGTSQQLKLKEKLHVRKLEVVDRADTEEARHMLELQPRVGNPVLLACASCAEKRNWMCDLVMLNTKPMLDRVLDSILLDLEKRHPLKLPPVALYRFAVADSPKNIVLEDPPANRQHAAQPLIKGATLLKLVERLTYHIYADLNLVRTFLTTYRSFCSPAELLDLLIERFRIPEPSEVYDTPRPAECIELVASSDAEKLSKNTAREDWKRYRKEFQQPVKFRVINVLRHWVDQHFYDFEREEALLDKLRAFLESVDGKPMKKWVQSVLKTLQRKSLVSEAEAGVSHVFDKAPPLPLRHVADPVRWAWHPLALHPLELARQLTLLEFRLYRQVKPSELVGAVWTKKEKEKTSPNLLRLIKHTTNFTRWLEKWIVESENIDERAGVLCRFLEVAVALRDLNNFNGVLSIVAACGSASVHRLRATFQMVPLRLVKALEDFRELNTDHFRRYQERLRSINPPCVPFFGMYLTNILHIEEGNLDFLPDSELINFSKRRKVAEITGEIQQYQNQPYCLTVEPKTRAFLESLDPFPGKDDNEITNYLYAKSLEIEPRPPAKQTPKFPRRYPELSTKQVKVRRTHAHAHSHAHDNHSHTVSSASSVTSLSSLSSLSSLASLASSHVNNCDDTLSMTSQISPTSTCGTNGAWDGASVQSLPVHHDEHRGSKSEIVSPRLERNSISQLNHLSQLSLFDKGLAFFDKKPSHNNKVNHRDEPPSPRDRHSPRHDRSVSLQSSTCERKPQTLSPRNAIVDAELFYSRSVDHLATTRKPEKSEQEPLPEPVPPLLPRASCTNGGGASPPAPPPPRRPSSPSQHCVLPPAACSTSNELPPEPPDRPLPSPKHDLFRMPAVSPKRSPAPQPPASPMVQNDRTLTFRFEWRAPPTPSPTAPPLTPHSSTSSCSTPPPLPPRRRRDSAAPPTPLPPSASNANSAPPPLPPRPTPPPELLRPAHSTILQRRHHRTSTNGAAPRLPPKPSPSSIPPPRT